MMRYSLVLVLAASAALMAGFANADPKPVFSGTANFVFPAVHSYTILGAPDPNPAHQAQCDSHYDRLLSRMNLTVQYKVDGMTQIGSAELLGISIPLHPMGIMGQYDFMTSEIVVPNQIVDSLKRVSFLMQSPTQTKKAGVLLVGGSDFNCELDAYSNS